MKFLTTLISIALAPLLATAQQDTTANAVKKTTLTVAVLANSNINYYGQAITEKLPYVLLNATLRLPFGLYFSAGSYKLLNYGSGISATDLGIGFDYQISEALELDATYTRSFYPENSPLLQASNENNINFTANYTWSALESSISTDFAFGQEKDVFLSFSNAKEILLGSFFSDKNTFYVAPAIELVAGTRHFYDTYIVAKNQRDKANGKAPSAPGNSGIAGKTETTTLPNNNFSLLAYNFKLPLSLNRASYIAEISYQYSILGARSEQALSRQQSYFGLAFYYQF